MTSGVQPTMRPLNRLRVMLDAERVPGRTASERELARLLKLPSSS